MRLLLDIKTLRYLQDNVYYRKLFMLLYMDSSYQFTKAYCSCVVNMLMAIYILYDAIHVESPLHLADCMVLFKAIHAMKCRSSAN